MHEAPLGGGRDVALDEREGDPGDLSPAVVDRERVAAAGDLLDTESNLIDEETREEVRDLLKSFGAWTRRVLYSADMAEAS